VLAAVCLVTLARFHRAPAGVAAPGQLAAARRK
jgi:hypothetical protein